MTPTNDGASLECDSERSREALRLNFAPVIAGDRNQLPRKGFRLSVKADKSSSRVKESRRPGPSHGIPSHVAQILCDRCRAPAVEEADASAHGMI